MTDVHGTCDPAYEPVRAALAETLAADEREGCALTVVVDGRTVVDLWGGAATGTQADGAPWQADTLAHAWSAIKPFAALSLLRLVDAGRVDLDERVATYWPEYAANGKEATTVRHVLSHAGGVVALRDPISVEALCDWGTTVGRIEAEAPFHPPGEGLGEQGLLYGHLVGEIARRVDGRGFGERLRAEVTGPLRLDVHVGLDDAQIARCADLAGLGPEWLRQLTRTGDPMNELVLGNPPGLRDSDVVNTDLWRRAEVPAVNGHMTARGLAGLYADLMSGTSTLLSPGLLADATTTQASGHDIVLDDDARWGLGFGLDETGYGMGGVGGSAGWADVSHGYAIGFVTRLMGTHERLDRLDTAVRGCL